MSAVKIILPLVGLALAVSAALGSKPAAAKPGAGTPSPSGDKSPGPAMLQQIAAALASADPEKMRAVARELDSQGFKSQATDLRSAADAVERAIASVPATPPATSSPGVQAPPAFSVPKPSIAPDAARTLAQRMALNLTNAAKGREDKDLVAAFQRQELTRQDPGTNLPFYTGKIDGLFGPKTAIALARDFGIVPPKPFYWPANKTPAAKAYTAELQRIAAVDPPRAEEWTRAARV